MATVSLSPTPAPMPAMSSRRAPLSSNPNVANSPLRTASALAGLAKQKRSYANIQREELYGQPPPVKKQALENGGQRAVRSPAALRTTAASRSHVLVQRGAASVVSATARPSPAINKERVSRAAATPAAVARATQVVDNEKEAWKKHYRAKFPKMVFYFESIPDDVRAKLTKRVTYFGARQEPFFSIEVTHVITTRAIPPERPEPDAASCDAEARIESGEEEGQPPQQQQQQRRGSDGQQPQTINPSLLDRNTAARRKLLFDFRQPPPAPPPHQLDDAAIRRNKARNSDVLHKAREMGKKIWSLDKFQTMLSVLLESESQNNNGSYASRTLSMRSQYGASKSSNEPSLLQLLHNERINGPSDRDPTAINRELAYFKGPYIYVWDMNEKQKPIMVREYAKVANKADGEWPQFRSVGNGRCPFVDESEVPEKDHRKSREREKARLAVAAAAAANRREDPVPMLKPPAMPPAMPLAGKRTLTEMEDGHNRAAHAVTSTTDVFNPAKAAIMSKHAAEMRMTQNAFTSRAEGARLFAGEPVASGMQPSNITSAIRSQMISSTSGINGGVKAGTSKEVHGLQRKVLQKAPTPASQQDISSRRLAEVSMDVASSRSTTMSRHTSRTVLAQDDNSQRTAAAAAAAAEDKEKRSLRFQSLKSKKDLKPGYCENCQDKFRDFDEHIASRKHRKFAENKENWTELDELLAQLKRIPRWPGADPDDDDVTW